MEGRVFESFRIGWHQAWGIVVSESLRDDLAKLAPRIQCIATKLEASSGERYFELEIRSHGFLEADAPPPCSACGRQPVDYPEDTPRIRDVPDLPLFRLRNFSTIVIAHESVLFFFKQEMGSASNYRRVQPVSGPR